MLLSCLTAPSRASISNQFNIAPIFLSIATHFVPTVSISLSRSLLRPCPPGGLLVPGSAGRLCLHRTSLHPCPCRPSPSAALGVRSALAFWLKEE